MQYFKHKLDSKNRLTVPAELHQQFEDGKAFIGPGFDKALHLYSQSVWEGRMQKALSGQFKTEGQLPAELDAELMTISDRLIEGLVETALDSKQGRVTIPDHLKKYAGIDSEVAATYYPAGGYWRLRKPTI